MITGSVNVDVLLSVGSNEHHGKQADRNIPVLGGISLDKPDTSPAGMFSDQFRLERIVFS
jgi:hypothetical protein